MATGTCISLALRHSSKRPLQHSIYSSPLMKDFVAGELEKEKKTAKDKSLKRLLLSGEHAVRHKPGEIFGIEPFNSASCGELTTISGEN